MTPARRHQATSPHPNVEQAATALAGALDDVRGCVPGRREPDRWFAASAAEREAAAHACDTCPLIGPCGVYAARGRRALGRTVVVR